MGDCLSNALPLAFCTIFCWRRGTWGCVCITSCGAAVGSGALVDSGAAVDSDAAVNTSAAVGSGS